MLVLIKVLKIILHFEDISLNFNEKKIVLLLKKVFKDSKCRIHGVTITFLYINERHEIFVTVMILVARLSCWLIIKLEFA